MSTSSWLLAMVVVGVLGLAVGRYTAQPAQVAAQERAQEAIVWQGAHRVDRVEVEALARSEAAERVVVRERVVYRDGPVAEVSREVEGSRSSVELERRSEAAEVRVEVQRVEVVREVERRVEVRLPLPSWRVSGLVGGRWGTGIEYGAHVERRLLGPIYVGAWGLSSGAVGVGLGVAF